MKYHLQTIRYHFLILMFISCFSESAIAGHFSAGDISYLHLGGNNYRVKVALYRDCMGVSAPGSITLTISSVSCALSFTQTLLQVPGSDEIITLPCPGTLTSCDGGTERGIEKWDYEGDVQMTAQCSDWTYSFSDCCIYAGNVMTGAALYLQARLNNLSSDNNSPQFTNFPNPTACVSQNFHYNDGMFDPDGDSLVYNLINAPGVTYVNPYSGQYPLNSVPPAAIDPVSGDYTMGPVNIEVPLVSYEITEFRNGTPIGSCMRTVIYYTVACSNNQPALSGMNGTSQNMAYVFPNDTVCFDIYSSDPDALDSLTLSWNNTIPAAIFAIAPAQHPVATFCWIPGMSDLRSQPYSFTATVKDNNCPQNAASVYGYLIYVTLDSSLVYTGLTEASESPLLIYPNPAEDLISIKCNGKISRLRIFNSRGQEVARNFFSSVIRISHLPGGIYFIEAETSENKFLRKIIEIR